MFINSARAPYGATDRDLIGVSHAAGVRRLLDLCPRYSATPLLRAPAAAAACGLASVHLKDERRRMGQPSFKALGGGHAVVKLALATAQATLGHKLAPADLQSAEVRAVARTMTFACASAGNHGLAVAVAARMVGAGAVVFLSRDVPEPFAARLRDVGADVRRAGETYEESMAQALATSEREGWVLVSDSSWADHADTALEVMRGYTVLFEEAVDALEQDGGPASHVFIQAGVGGLAAAAAGYLRDRWGEGFKLVVVEPEGAACLVQSMKAGRALTIERGDTVLGRLDCATPSLLAFEMLSRLADVFMTITDAEAMRAAERLNAEGAATSACGAAGAAGLFSLCADADAALALGLDHKARVLLIATEAAVS